MACDSESDEGIAATSEQKRHRRQMDAKRTLPKKKDPGGTARQLELIDSLLLVLNLLRIITECTQGPRRAGHCWGKGKGNVGNLIRVNTAPAELRCT